MVEFAIVVPLLILLLCGIIDFGLMFSGDMSMQSGVASAARAISLDNYTYSGNACSQGGVANTPTADAVCNIVATLGPLVGVNTNTLSVGICFNTPGSTLSCGGTPATGTSVADDVVVCTQAPLESTTGLTSIFVSGTTVYTSSRQLMEQPQPSSTTAFDSYNASSTGSSQVSYNGKAIPGLTCT